METSNTTETANADNNEVVVPLATETIDFSTLGPELLAAYMEYLNAIGYATHTTNEAEPEAPINL